MTREEDVPRRIPRVAVDHGLVHGPVLKGIEADELHVLLFFLVLVVILVLIVGPVGRGPTGPRTDHRRGGGLGSHERRAGDGDGAGTYPDKQFPTAEPIF